MVDGRLVPAAPPGDATDDAVEQVYLQIRGMQRDATLSLLIGIGKVIVDGFYGGDLEAVRSLTPAKDASLRKLADRFAQDGEIGLNAMGLSRAVSTYEMDTRLHLEDRKELTASHVRAVIGLPPAQQAELLDEAEAEDLTVKQLEDRVREARPASGNPGAGRKPLPAVVKTMNALAKIVGEAGAFGGVGELSDAQEEKVRAQLAAVEGALEAVRKV